MTELLFFHFTDLFQQVAAVLVPSKSILIVFVFYIYSTEVIPCMITITCYDANHCIDDKDA